MTRGDDLWRGMTVHRCRSSLDQVCYAHGAILTLSSVRLSVTLRYHDHGMVLVLGVRQGSVLSPYLFAVYVNDVDCSSTGRHVVLCADDIILIASSISELEKL